MPHAQAVYAYGKYLGQEDFAQAELAEKLSQYFKLRGSYYTAIALAEEAVNWREKAQAINNPNRSLAVENLNEILDAQAHGNYDVYLQVLPRWETWYLNWEKSVGMEHKLAWLALQNLTRSLMCESEFEALQQIKVRGEKARQRMGENEDGFTDSRRKASACEEEAEFDELMNKRQKIPDAEAHHANWEKSLGPHHAVTIKSMRNRVASAASKHRRSVERFGPGHPSTTLSKQTLMAAT